MRPKLTHSCSILSAILLGLMFGGLITLVVAFVWMYGWG